MCMIYIYNNHSLYSRYITNFLIDYSIEIYVEHGLRSLNQRYQACLQQGLEHKSETHCQYSWCIEDTFGIFET